MPNESPSTPYIQFKHVSKAFGDNRVLDDVSFTATDRPIRHEQVAAQRRDFTHETFAVDPRIDTLLKGQVHTGRTHLDVEQVFSGMEQILKDRHIS